MSAAGRDQTGVRLYETDRAEGQVALRRIAPESDRAAERGPGTDVCGAERGGKVVGPNEKGTRKCPIRALL